jgi:tetratricopeptide (TPR) repeat protein
MSDPAGGPVPASSRFRVARLGDLDRIPAADDISWRPLRRTLGVTAFGINAYTADEPGDPLIERHDETGSGAGGHEELYVVMTGHGRFTVAGEEVDAPAGTFVFIHDPAARREATAVAPDTTVLAVGGRPGAALPVSPWEHWFAAEPAYRAGDYDRAIAIVSGGLEDYPDHPTIHYQLACYHALAGRRADALRHLRIAFDGDERTREWAATDRDLDAIRDDPELRRQA